MLSRSTHVAGTYLIAWIQSYFITVSSYSEKWCNSPLHEHIIRQLNFAYYSQQIVQHGILGIFFFFLSGKSGCFPNEKVQVGLSLEQNVMYAQYCGNAQINDTVVVWFGFLGTWRVWAETCSDFFFFWISENAISECPLCLVNLWY